MMRPTGAAALLLATLAGIGPARADEGRIELNQARAVAGNVTGTGVDAPGFPITLDLPGSYVLSSDLLVGAADTDAIEITAARVTLDLAGFAIAGPVVCSAPPAPIACGAGSGRGAVAIGRMIAVHGGAIEGFGGSGIELAEEAVIHDLHVAGNGGHGIVAGARSRVSACLVVGNGGDGVVLGAEGLLSECAINANNGVGALLAADAGYTGNAINGNTGGEVSGGVSMSPNLCGGVVPCGGAPGAELCDGLDNDLDGLFDEDFPSLGDTCSVGVGGCSRVGIEVCTEDGTGTECSAEPATSATEICDGLDNDCDGTVDEGFPGLGGSCLVGTGQCAAPGVEVCSGDGSTTQCSASPGASSAEICDGFDNDCDGLIDEDFPSVGAPCSAGIGQCARVGVEVCSGDGSTAVCSVAPGPAGVEVCDGADNDCNGTIDDGLAASSCLLQGGVCSGSVQTCTGTGGFVACGPLEYGPSYQSVETACDGLDNDCDGAVDNGLTRPLCALQSGVCAGTIQTCAGASGYQACTDAEYGPSYEPVEASCDSLDNDCNGLIDEPFPTRGDPCIVGTGQCTNVGALVCRADGTGTICSVSPRDPGAEVCDGIDNDCDGTIDNGIAGPPPCTNQQGVCAGSTQTCGGAAGFLSCGPFEFGPSFEIVEFTCDGLDNDCDGVVDEGVCP